MTTKEIQLEVVCRTCGSYFHATGAKQCQGNLESLGEGYSWCEKCEWFRHDSHSKHKKLIETRGKAIWETVE